MPRVYRVTGPDGHDYEFDWDADRDPTPQEVDALFAKPTEPTESEPSGIFGRSMDTLGRVGNVLSRLTGGTAVAAGVNAYQKGEPILENIKDAYTPTGWGTFKENPMGDDVMANMGMEPGLKRAALGLGFDILTDPGNMLGGTALRVLGKGDDIAKTLDKVTDTLPGIKTGKNVLEQAFTMRPQTKNILSNAGDIEYNDLARLYDSASRHAAELGQSQAEDLFRLPGSGHVFEKYVPQADRIKIAHAIDTGTQHTLSPEYQKIAQGFKDKMDELHQVQVQLGNLTPDQKIQNYVQYLTKEGRDVEAIVAPNVSSVPQSARKREAFKTLADAAKHGGATEDAMEIFARSTAQVEKAKSRVEFIDEVAKRFQNANGREINTAYLNVSPAVKQRLQGIKLDERIAQDLEKAIKVWDSPTELDNLVVTANKLFKASVTAPMPSHHINNFMGNIHNMYVAGDMSTADIAKQMTKAFKVIRETDPAKRAAMLGSKGQDILNAAKKFEVIGTSAHLGELDAEGTAKVLNRAIFKIPRKIGTEYVEEPARLALFMDQLDKGANYEQAALKVKNVLFDYAELTPSEKKIRDYGLIPFYTWMRKNIPLQIGAMIRHPEKVEAITNMMNVPWNAVQSDDQTIVPRDFQNQGYVPFNAPAEYGLPVMARWAMPMYDVNKLGSPEAFLKDSLGPLVKMPIEAIMQKKMNNAPLDSPTGFSRPSGIANIIGMTGIDNITPGSLKGMIAPTDVGGRPMQRDRWAWITGQIPTGPLGSTFAGNDPLNPRLERMDTEFIMRLLGLTPNVITPNDQKYEMIDRKGDIKRDMIKKIVLEQ